MISNKKILLFLIVLIISITGNCYSQYSLEWTARYSSSWDNSSDYVYDINLDKNNNVFLFGESNGLFLTMKYNNSGNLEWTQRDSVNFIMYRAEPGNMTTDDSGNVYVTGASTVTPFNLDYKTIKYNSSGVRQWVRIYDNPVGASDRPSKIINFNNKYIYVTGANSYGDSGLSSFKWTTIKYDVNGNALWTKQFGGNYYYPLGDYGPEPAMTVDSSGDVIITGQNINISTNEYEIVTIKYDSSGNQLWNVKSKNVFSNGAISVDKFSNIYVGVEGGLIKYNSEGDSIWALNSTYAQNFEIDNNDNIVLTGTNSNQYKIVTSKYNLSGNLLWNSETISGFYYASMCVSKSGKTFIAANHLGTDYKYYIFVYNPDGSQFWYGEYDDIIDPTCIPIKIVADEYDNFYITGRSSGSGNNKNILTLKYSIVTNTSTNLSNLSNNYSISQNYPNPFNPTTTINYQLGYTNFVSLKVFDIHGREIRSLVNEKQNAGTYSVEFNGEDLPSGVYYYRLESGTPGEAVNFSQTKKMLLIK